MNRYCLGLLVVLLLGLVSGRTSIAAEPPKDLQTLAPDKLRKGMTGHGKTIFEGNTIDTFSVEVKGVLEDALPDQDLILIKASHPILKSTQIMSGMSGSPIYVNGKLIGALAYSWKFSKKPIAGVTPIRRIFEANRSNFLTSQNRNLRQVGASLSVRGIQGRYRDVLEKKLSRYGIQVRTVISGSGGSKRSVPHQTETTEPLKPGEALGAQLMKGDLSLTAIGTVTYVNGDRVYAFGHPFLNSGRIELPMTTAKVHLPMPNVRSSFKMSSPVRTVGTITDDRQAALVGKSGVTPEMLPVNIKLKTPKMDFSETYSLKVIRNRYLTPGLINMAASNFASRKMNQIGLNRVESRIHLDLSRNKDVILRESSVVSGSFDPWAFTSLPDLWQNPFRRPSVKKVDLSLTMEPRRETAKIKDIWLNKSTVQPGESLTIYTTVKPYRSESLTKSVKVKIPPTLQGDKIRVHVVPGSSLRTLQADPKTFNQLINNLNNNRLDTELGILVQVPQVALKAEGYRLKTLPYSFSGVFKRATVSSAEYKPATIVRSVDTNWVLQGKRTLTVSIRN